MATGDDSGWWVFDACERTAFEEQHRFKPRKADCTNIRNRFKALDKDERQARVDAITSLRTAQETLRNALIAVRAALSYNGLNGVTEGKDFKEYIRLEKAAGAAAGTAVRQLNALIKILPESSDFVHSHLDSTVRGKLDEVIEGVEAVTKKKKVQQQDIWRSKLRSARRRAQALTEPGWYGYWKIGEGAFGTADLWVKQDTSGKVIDRAVVKDTLMKDEFWNDHCLWINGLPDEDTSVPTEMQSLYNLRPRIGSSSIVEIRNWRIERSDRIHRIYVEFCPRGDAQSLILAENLYGKHPRFDEDNEEKDVKEEGPSLPEPLLWFLFETLIMAALLMERGELDPQGSAPWDLVVHRDMKLANVFFGTNASGIYRGYPDPKLGDFGIAIIAPSKNNPARDEEGRDVERKPEDIPEMGTVGCKAPEQYEKFLQNDGVKGGKVQFEPLSTLTNVWGIGVVMYSAIICDNGLEVHFKERHKSKDPLEESDWNIPEFDPSAQAYYSNELLGLIRSCLAYRPKDRLSPDEVMRAIRQNTAPGKNDKSEGMRLEDANDIRFLTEHGVNFVTADRYYPGSDLWAWDPPGTDTAVDDPPLQQAPIYPGEEDLLGGNPGGPIDPEVPETVPAPEDDGEDDVVEDGRDEGGPGELAAAGHDPGEPAEGEEEGEDRNIDIEPGASENAPKKRKATGQKKNGGTAAGQRPKRQKRNDPDPGTEDQGDESGERAIDDEVTNEAASTSARPKRPTRGQNRKASEVEREDGEDGPAAPSKGRKAKAVKKGKTAGDDRTAAAPKAGGKKQKPKPAAATAAPPAKAKAKAKQKAGAPDDDADSARQTRAKGRP